MSLMQALLQRLLPLFGGLFASQVETGIVLEQAEQLNAIEERARQFEREGKTELADALRRQCTRIQSDDPARTGLRILANFEEGANSSSSTPLLTTEPSEPEQKPPATSDSKPKRRTRRTSRRPSEQSKPAPESSEGEGRSCLDT